VGIGKDTAEGVGEGWEEVGKEEGVRDGDTNVFSRE